MNTGIIQLKLSFPHYNEQVDLAERHDRKNLLYRVEEVVGSVQYVPGDKLTRDEVSDLCEMTGRFKIIVLKRKD